ncbi:hypothetical protein ES703_23152 [subsurface metagenome]
MHGIHDKSHIVSFSLPNEDEAKRQTRHYRGRDWDSSNMAVGLGLPMTSMTCERV